MHPVTYQNGKATWIRQPGDTYLCTGTLCNGSRFRMECDGWVHCAGINLYRGTKWLVRDGKRYRLVRVWN